jgi:hypothetical protein
MAYSIYKSDGTLLINLADQTADTTVSPLTLIGRGLLNFGKSEAENIIHLLENFANNAAPAHAMVGQFWYDKGQGKMKYWNGSSWLRVHSGVDDANIIPGFAFGSGLTLSGSTVTANMRSVSGRTGDVVLGVSDIAGAAPLNSPVLTGEPTATSPAEGDISLRIANTYWVKNQIQRDTLNYTAGLGLSVTDSNTKLSVVGTTNRITVSNAGVDIASTYAGQGSITTLGTVTTGQWAASTIPLDRGGTGGTTADEARGALNALKYNALADSLKSVGNGLLVNNNGSSLARQVVSGTPEKISVTNGNGVGGDITISLLGGDNGPTAISGGGTGQTTKLAGFNALSPASNTGDLIVYGSGGHERLASRADNGFLFFLTCGNNDPKPRWTKDLDAKYVSGKDIDWITSRSNHTGTNYADQLNGREGSYYLDYKNFTGDFPKTAVVTSSSDLKNPGSSGYIRFNSGFTVQWGFVVDYNAREQMVSMTFPVAFTTLYSIVPIVVGNNGGGTYQNFWLQIVNMSGTGCNFFYQAADDRREAVLGYSWTAFGYIE